MTEDHTREVLALLELLDQLTVTEHAEVYADVHDRLQGVLAAIDEV